MTNSSAFAAHYAVADPPHRVATDQGLFLDVILTNTGSAPWPDRPPHPITLSYRWQDSGGHSAIADGRHIALPHTLAPGQQASVELPVEPPARPGAYTLLLDLVQEGVAWLSTQGVPPHPLTIEVTEPAPAARRVTLISNDSRLDDAMGNNLLEQLRFFRGRGDNVLALLEHVDERQPRQVRSGLFRISLDDLLGGSDNPLTRRAVEHFHSSSLFIFNYSTYYRLAQAIRLVQRGQVLFDYHAI